MYKHILSDKEGNFELYLAQPAYKQIKVPEGVGYIKNKKTGESIGQKLKLIEYRFNIDGTRFENPHREEDCYELVMF